ncbi:ribosome assembly RNA-binding protein YhbY [Alkalithermobacter paradoxus]|uniref:RNA-binding protein n=1 Tax=Alkalithermobacter paradoxus TaxID=29349 RepID=A0A1V4I6P7_9FIRM|nr:RNA-binding protein [[Clostridium] thermoalcaliphilum]
MLTGKQRAYLKSIANGLKPITQIGKEGITEAFLKQLDDALRAREIVKVNILENSGLDAKETANEVARLVRGEFVQAIGSKFTIYKKNIEKPIIELPK